MEWDVKTVDVYPTKADHSNVIYNVHWRVSKTEGEDYAASSYGTQSLATDDLKKFIDFDKVKLAQVEAWVVNAMGEEAVAELEANLDAQIEAQKNPTTETKTIAK
tara:strand:- start:210 stop:524 length:315 start_codon:yes stop_codon:yes gene_type:complete